jgi:hypothetical protein
MMARRYIRRSLLVCLTLVYTQLACCRPPATHAPASHTQKPRCEQVRAMKSRPLWRNIGPQHCVLHIELHTAWRAAANECCRSSVSRNTPAATIELHSCGVQFLLLCPLQHAHFLVCKHCFRIRSRQQHARRLLMHALLFMPTQKTAPTPSPFVTIVAQAGWARL